MSRLLRPVPIVVLCGVLALIALLAYGVSTKHDDTSIDTALAAGRRPPAPALTLPQLGGSHPLSLASFRGQVVVVNFWASWCDPCRAESPLLQRWQQRLRRRRATVLGVDVLDVSSDAQAFVRKFKLTYPQVRDGDGSQLKRFDVVGYPETVEVDRRGRIAATSRGPVDDAFFMRRVVPLLREPA